MREIDSKALENGGQGFRLSTGDLRLYLPALLVLQIITVASLLPTALDGKTDFRTFYATGHMIHSGQLYDYAAELAAQNTWVSPNRFALPFMSPPYAALPFELLAHFSYRTAYFIFFVLNVGLCFASSLIMGRFCPELNTRYKPLLPVLFLSFWPLGRALAFGQLSIVLLVVYCAAFALLQEDWAFVAGMCLSVALIKFQTAIPVAVLFLVWRQWRFISGFLTGTLVFILLSLRLVGAKAFAAYLHSLVSMSSQTSNEARFAMFSAQMPNLYGLFHSFAPGKTGFVLTAVCSLVVLAWAASRRPSLPLALLAALLVSFHLYAYDLTLLLLPLSLALDAAFAGRVNRIAVFAGLVFLSMSVLHGFIPADYHYLLAIPLIALFFCFPNATGTLPTNWRPHAAQATVSA